jgi:hypothetical protein
MKPIHRIPIERLPNALAIMSPKQKQSGTRSSIRSIAMAAPVDRRRRSAAHCGRAILKRF